VAKFTYLETTLTDQSFMQEACYHSVQNLLPSCLLPKNVKIKIYRTIILPAVMCGCETRTLTLREEHRLRVFENRILRRKFGPMKDEITGEWRKLYNKELHYLYSSSNIIRQNQPRRIKVVGSCDTHGRGEKIVQDFRGKARRKESTRKTET
jgi:hypothetical protein